MALKFKTSREADDALAQLLQLAQFSEQRQDRKESGIVADLNNIMKLSQGALTPEQIQTAQNALSNMSGLDMSDTTKIASQVTQSALDNKKFEMNQYESRIDQASAIFSDPNYLDTADEWRDLETLRKSDLYKKDDGTYKYESTAEMLGDLYSQANTIYEGIESGSAKGFKTDANIDFFDDEVKTKLATYKSRLEKAIASDLGDGIITVDEAQLIMSGVDKVGFKTYITDRRNESAKAIKTQEAIVNTYKSANPLAFLQTMAGDEESGNEFLEALGEDNINTILSMQAVPQATIEEAERELTRLYGRYKYWSGSSYQGVTDAPATDAGELRLFAGEDEIGETVVVPAIDEVTEVTEEELKKIEEDKKKKLLKKEEKELIDMYDSDMVRLEEIDKTLKGIGATLTTEDRKKLALERKKIKEKWRDEGGGVIKDAEGNVIADFRKGLKQKVLELKKLQK